VLGYNFSNPALLVQALTHKSFKEHYNTMRENQGSLDTQIDDYERLEFLGDSILNFLVAQYYFTTTGDSPHDFQPKQLHKLKTAVVNNVFLSLIVVQRGIHNFVLYNQNSEQFKKQFDQYVQVVAEILARSRQADQAMPEGNRSRAEALSEQEFGNVNIEPLYEHSLKIFGDIFESIIGAVFIDCKSISQTERVLHSMLRPFLKTHTHVEQLDDHSRTKLLELWNSKSYSRQLKIKHDV